MVSAKSLFENLTASVASVTRFWDATDVTANKHAAMLNIRIGFIKCIFYLFRYLQPQFGGRRPSFVKIAG